METAAPTNPAASANSNHTQASLHTSWNTITTLEIALAMRLTGSGAYSRPAPVPKMPPGLVQLMEGLARDVLKHNPSNVEEFCARHVEQLLIIRDGQAPSKRRLTLEEKIKRAQEKVREKAEQRRRIYDEAMKKYNDSVTAGTSSAMEANQVDTSSNQKDKLVTEEEVSSKEPITETKLKAPVYHDKDLAEALEVEIFHKPIQEVRPSIVNDIIDNNKILEEVSEATNEDLKQEMKGKDTFESISKTNGDTLDKIDAQEVFEAAIGNESEANGSHTRSRRSVNPEDNGQDEEDSGVKNVVIEVVEEQKDEPENAGKLKETGNRQALIEITTSSEPALNKNNLEDVKGVSNTKEVENTESKEHIKNQVLNSTVHSLTAIPNENTSVHIVGPENLNNTEVQTKTKLEAGNGARDDSLFDSQPVNGNSFERDHIDENTIGSEVQDTVINVEQKIDEATVFANEVLTASVTPIPNVIHEKINKDSEILLDVEGILEPSPASPAEVDSVFNDSMVIQDNTLNEAHNEEAEEKVKVDKETLRNTSSTEKSIGETIHDSNESNESNSESVSRLGVADNITLHKEDHNSLNTENLSDKLDESIVSDKNQLDMTTVINKKSEIKLDDANLVKEATEEKLAAKENTESNQNENHDVYQLEKTSENDLAKNTESIENENHVRSPVEKTPESNLEKTESKENGNQIVSSLVKTSENYTSNEFANNDEKIVEALEKLEVFSGHIEGHSNKNYDPNSDEPKTEFSEKETASDFYEIINNSTPEKNCDVAITTVDEVLIKDPGEIKDDNDAVPEQEITENNTSRNNVHVNGSLEPETVKGNVENGNEYVEQKILLPANDMNPNQDIQENKITTEAHDDLTSTSELIKTDIETSSLGKSSSMDDSYIDEGDSLAAIEDTKTGTEDDHKKEASGMDLETAAITIQKVFRTFLFKSRESTFDDPGIGGGDSIDGDSEKTKVEFPVPAAPLNKERRTLGISRMDTVLQTVNEEKSLSLSTDDSSLSSAATVIQKHVRGFLTRNRLNSNKTNSSSLVNSDGNPSSTSLEHDVEQKANKTVLNIHIVPEGEHFLSRDESLLTSMELSLDGSPPSSTNLHPLGYDKSEPRKQLKREDAIQSISPPSNNSGKLSEDVESVKEMQTADNNEQQNATDNLKDETLKDLDMDRDDTPTKSTTIETVIETQKLTKDISSSPEPEKEDVDTAVRRKRSINLSSDEGDVVTPYEDRNSTDSDATSRLLHSGEFHDVVLPTKVLRGDTTVVRGE